MPLLTEPATMPSPWGLQLASDWIGIGGLIISLVGFGITIFSVFRTKTAAQQAREAAESARKRFVQADYIAGLSSVVAKLEEIKRLHRLKVWVLFPDRYSEIRHLIASIKNSQLEASEADQTILQNVIAQFANMEREAEQEIQNEKHDDSKLIRFNELISSLMDELNDISCSSRNNTGAD